MMGNRQALWGMPAMADCVVLLSGSQNVGQRRGAAVEMIERVEKPVHRLLPRIADRSCRPKTRREIWGDHDFFGIHPEGNRYSPRLLGIHYDDEVRSSYPWRRNETRTVPGEIYTPLFTERDRDRRSCASTADESSGRDLNVFKISAKRRLQVWTAAHVAVAHYKNAARAGRARQPSTHGNMTKWMKGSLKLHRGRLTEILESVCGSQDGPTASA